MLSCYIVDDESHAVDVLTKYVARTPGLTLAGSNNDPVTGLNEVRIISPDIIFLDIDMPGMSGIEFLHMLTEKSAVVFTTALTAYAVEAYIHNLTDYLLKPISYERFLNCIGRQEARLANNRQQQQVVARDYFFVQCELKSKMVRINFGDISYVESLNNYVIIHQNNQKNIAYITLKEVLDFLPDTQFTRIHKSFIINDDRIHSIVGNQVYLTGKELQAIAIGQTYREGFFNKVSLRSLKRH
jgi:DNA-binding LytR/AlgR family response regulator